VLGSRHISARFGLRVIYAVADNVPTDDGFVALEVLVEPEDLDIVLKRSVPASPADVGTAHMEAPIDREVLARLRRLQRVKTSRTLWPSSPACFWKMRARGSWR
jgi:hypothetical protein